MKFTKYFLYIRQRPDRAKIKTEWIEETIKNPDYTEVQSDGRTSVVRPALLYIISQAVIPAPYQVRGKLQRESSLCSGSRFSSGSLDSGSSPE